MIADEICKELAKAGCKCVWGIDERGYTFTCEYGTEARAYLLGVTDELGTGLWLDERSVWILGDDLYAVYRRLRDVRTGDLSQS